MELNVDIVSAEGEIYSGAADMVFASAEMGEVGIAPRHAPRVSSRSSSPAAFSKSSRTR